MGGWSRLSHRSEVRGYQPVPCYSTGTWGRNLGSFRLSSTLNLLTLVSGDAAGAPASCQILFSMVETACCRLVVPCLPEHTLSRSS